MKPRASLSLSLHISHLYLSSSLSACIYVILICIYVILIYIFCSVTSLSRSLSPPASQHARTQTHTSGERVCMCSTHHSHMSTLNKCAYTESWVLLRLLQKFEMESRSKLAVNSLNFSLPFSRARSVPPIASLRRARDFDICICVCAGMCALI